MTSFLSWLDAPRFLWPLISLSERGASSLPLHAGSHWATFDAKMANARSVARQWMSLEYFKMAWKFQNKLTHVHGPSLEKGEFYFVVFEA